MSGGGGGGWNARKCDNNDVNSGDVHASAARREEAQESQFHNQHFIRNKRIPEATLQAEKERGKGEGTGRMSPEENTEMGGTEQRL